MAFPTNTLFLLIVVYMFYYHCYSQLWLLPRMFMKAAIVPIIINKTGDTSDKNNYRPIALVTAA